MGYRFVEGHTRADVAFEADGGSLEELLSSSCQAVTRVMCENPEAIEGKEAREAEVEGSDPERLLHAALQEMLFFKDAENLIFNRFSFTLGREGSAYKAWMRMEGQEIDVSRHRMIVDIKAVSWHKFRVRQDCGRWMAFVIVDV